MDVKKTLYLTLILLTLSFAMVQQSFAQVPCGPTIFPSRTLSIDWPQLGFDAARSGCNPYESILNQGTIRNLTLAWQYTTQANDAVPVLADGIVFFSDFSGTLYAINAGTGALLWSNQPLANGYWGASAATANGVVYLGFRDDQHGATDGLYAFNEHTGALLWRKSGVGEVSPTVANGVVYVFDTDNGGLIALNANTGELLWTYPINGEPESPVMLANGIVYAISTDGSANALNASTGTLVWKVQLHTYPIYAATFANNVLYVGDIVFHNSHLWALNASTGAGIWNISNNYGVHSLAVADGIVYMGAVVGDGQVYALNASTGATMWQYQRGGNSVNSHFAIANGILYFGTGGITSDFWALNAKFGTILWEYPNFNTTTPIVANGKVYIGLASGVAAFHLPGQ